MGRGLFDRRHLRLLTIRLIDTADINVAAPATPASTGRRAWFSPSRPYATRTGMAPLLQVRDLRTSFFTSDGEVRAVDRATFDIEDGRTVGLVGESGCGKSVTALSIITLPANATARLT